MAHAKTRSTLLIHPVTDHPTVTFAAQELARCLEEMLLDDPQVHAVEVTGLSPGPAPERRPVIRLGLFADLQAPEDGWPQVIDPKWDDAVAFDVQRGHGLIGGVNPRSVLLGIYRFLTACGCRWPRPAPDAEQIPARALWDLTARASETPSYRHRAICIEGAVSYRNVADMIDWAPKVGFNGYFTQFRESYIFFERWYGHRDNPLLAPEPFDLERARSFMDHLRGEIAVRGLLYHAVGHGWTCEPLGIPGLGWDTDVYTVEPEMRELLAEVDGERQIWRGVPLNTNLCYSNPRARALVVQSIVDYLEAHPNVDLLHFWLADGSNNHCECENCREIRPSDYYVRMLNELDALLTKRGIDTRIVFLIYVDLLWPPQSERLANPDRFVLMFAPITRSYREPFPSQPTSDELPPYRRNALTFPSDPAQNVAHLRAWQRLFDGDSFAFEYHLWRAHYADPGQLTISRVLWEDLRTLQDLGLNGYVSCQVQRAFFPTGLPMYVLARTLWDRDAKLETIQDEYLATLGEEGGLALEYLRRISTLFEDLGNLDALTTLDPRREAVLAQVEAIVEGFGPTISRNLAHPDPGVAQSWLYLRHHCALLRGLVGTIRARASGQQLDARRAWQRLERYLQRHESTLQPVLDVWAYLHTLRRAFGA